MYKRTEREIAEKITNIDFSANKKIGTCVNEFYQIMIEYGICKNSRSENSIGMIGNNFEWTLYEELFLARFNSSISFNMSLGCEKGFKVPKEIECYNE